MTQVATRDTVDRDEALDAIAREPKVIQLSTHESVAYIAYDHPATHEHGEDRYLVDAFVSVIGERRELSVGRDEAAEAIANADTARLRDPDGSPFEDLWTEDQDQEVVDDGS